MGYRVTKRIFNEGKLVGYYMTSEADGKEVKFSLEAIAKLGKSGEITNATLFKNGNSYALRGKGVKLQDLPCVELKKVVKESKAAKQNRTDKHIQNSKNQLSLKGNQKFSGALKDMFKNVHNNRFKLEKDSIQRIVELSRINTNEKLGDYFALYGAVLKSLSGFGWYFENCGDPAQALYEFYDIYLDDLGCGLYFIGVCARFVKDRMKSLIEKYSDEFEYMINSCGWKKYKYCESGYFNNILNMLEEFPYYDICFVMPFKFNLEDSTYSFGQEVRIVMYRDLGSEFGCIGKNIHMLRARPYGLDEFDIKDVIKGGFSEVSHTSYDIMYDKLKDAVYAIDYCYDKFALSEFKHSIFAGYAIDDIFRAFMYLNSRLYILGYKYSLKLLESSCSKKGVMHVKLLLLHEKLKSGHTIAIDGIFDTHVYEPISKDWGDGVPDDAHIIVTSYKDGTKYSKSVATMAWNRNDYRHHSNCIPISFAYFNCILYHLDLSDREIEYHIGHCSKNYDYSHLLKYSISGDEFLTEFEELRDKDMTEALKRIDRFDIGLKHDMNDKPDLC